MTGGRPYARLRVLINEDHPADAELIEREVRRVIPEPEFRRVQTREAFQEALAVFRPELIISDFNLPNFDGSEALRMVRAEDAERPFILISGSLGEELAIDTMKAGATDYVLKDRLKRLAPAVERALKDADARKARGKAAEALQAMEGRLEERDRLLETIFEEAPVGIAVIAIDGTVMLANKRYDAQLGCPRGSLVGRSVLDFTYADDLPESRAKLEAAAAGTIPSYAMEKRYVRCDGAVMWAELTATVLHDASDRPRFVLTMLLDTSERRRLLDVMLRQERLRALGQMASAIAHDVNNALSPVLGYAELLEIQEDSLSAGGRRHLLTIKTAAGDIAKIVGRMKEFYQTREVGEIPVLLEVNGLLEEAIEMTAPRWRTEARKHGHPIALARDLAPGLPWMKGVATDIRECLVNLIFNAVDALPQGGQVTLRSARRGDSIILEVIDSGSGMDEATRSRCLEPFFTTKGAAGTGLGLASVAAVMRRHAGEVEIESEPGHGTTIRLVFPLPEPAEGQRPGDVPLALKK